MTAFVCCFKVSMRVSSGENEHGSAKGRRQDYCACNPLFILSHFHHNTLGPCRRMIRNAPRGPLGGSVPCNGFEGQNHETKAFPEKDSFERAHSEKMCVDRRPQFMPPKGQRKIVSWQAICLRAALTPGDPHERRQERSILLLAASLGAGANHLSDFIREALAETTKDSTAGLTAPLASASPTRPPTRG